MVRLSATLAFAAERQVVSQRGVPRFVRPQHIGEAISGAMTQDETARLIGRLQNEKIVGLAVESP